MKLLKKNKITIAAIVCALIFSVCFLTTTYNSSNQIKDTQVVVECNFDTAKTENFSTISADSLIFDTTYKEEGTTVTVPVDDEPTDSSGGIQFDQQTTNSTTVGDMVLDFFEEHMWLLFVLILIGFLFVVWVIVKIFKLILFLFRKK